MIREGLEWTLFDSPINLEEVTIPTVVEADTLKLYAKDKSGVSSLYYMGDDLVEHNVGSVFGGGNGVVNRLAYWLDTNTIDDIGRTFTAGSILFAGTDFLPQEDNAGLFYNDTDDRLGIGTAIPAFGLDIQATDGDASLAITRISSNSSPSTIVGRKGRAGPSAVIANDELFSIVARGYDGSAYSTGGFLEWIATETWSGSARGNFLKLVTTADGSATPTERFRVGQSGQWGIGGATFGTSLDVFTSGGALAAPSWVSPGALTKTDDTNVTLTLGGTPATALLRAASLTLGWTGVLAQARGGTGTATPTVTDWLPQYALLAGRAGGQTLKGGTAASETLTLVSTANATKGKILFGSSAYDEVNNGLGIRTTDLASLGSLLQIDAPSNTNALLIKNSDLAGVAAWVIYPFTNGLDTNLQMFEYRPSASNGIRFIFKSGGNLGIGVDPSEQLHITGNLRLPATTATTGIIKSDANTLLHILGTESVYLGVGAGNLTTTSGRNTAIGFNALNATTTGGFNVAIGRRAGVFIQDGQLNTIVGMNALATCVSGSDNVAIGANALNAATGSQLAVIGSGACQNLSTATNVVAIGYNVMPVLTTGGSNTGVGSGILGACVDGTFNTGIGRNSLTGVTSGSENTGIGIATGQAITTGNQNTFIGTQAAAGSATISNATAIGALASVGQSNHMILGADTECVGIGTSSARPTGTRGLIFSDGTALSGMATNTAGLYADDISGNVSMHAINENGDIIKLIKTGTYTPSNVTADRSYDANSTTIDELADILGTLIADLQLTGLIG